VRPSPIDRGSSYVPGFASPTDAAGLARSGHCGDTALPDDELDRITERDRDRQTARLIASGQDPLNQL
jgi:hypothetical protein